MPVEPTIQKAYIQEISWSEDGQVSEGTKRVDVQFNPETLKVAFANQKAGGDQRGGSAIQYVGKGTTKLSLDLVFDVTVPLADGSMQPDGDVRKLTKDIAYFITPKVAGSDQDQFLPPGVRFVWGSFLFDGVMDSLNENLTYFSSQGKPLRSTVTINLSQQEIQFRFNPTTPGPGGTPPTGTQPLTQAEEGQSLQQMASNDGQGSNWTEIAENNNIDNPRHIPEGTHISM